MHTINIAPQENTWLCRFENNDVRGPFKQSVLAEKIKRGEVSLDTHVARDGTDFYPLLQVKAFASVVAELEAMRQEKARKRVRNIVYGVVVPACLLLVCVGAWIFYTSSQERSLRARERATLESAWAKKQQAYAALPQMGLVSWVHLGSAQDISVGRKRVHVPAHVRVRGSTHHASLRVRDSVQDSASVSDNEVVVVGCQLSQNQIFETLRQSVGKLNFCVEDEKARDTEHVLPETLQLEFVVQNTGTVVDFRILERRLRIGPLNNCMVKAFQTITFPESTGDNCPVTLPIRIGT